jgi:hypothetical protein
MTSTVTRWALAGALALAALGPVGGFIPGAATAEAAPDVSPFAGSWSGTWSNDGAGHYGRFDWTISNQGRISGRVYPLPEDVSSGTGGAVVGQVGADGNIMMVGFAPNDAPDSGANGYPFHGTAEIDEDGTLVAMMTGAEGFGGNLLVAVLERQ